MSLGGVLCGGPAEGNTMLVRQGLWDGSGAGEIEIEFGTVRRERGY